MSTQGYFVRAVPVAATIANPQTQIAIAVDTAYVAAQGGSNLSAGIYMMDNQVNLGSSNEGQMELGTVCNNGNQIGFSVYPMDVNSGDKVAITGFNVSQGNVFGSAGYPLSITPAYWIGQAMNTGQQTYQIQIKVTTGPKGRRINYYISWDPFITSQ